MNEYLPETKSLGGRLKVELYLSNYATKSDLKSARDFDTSKFAKEVDLANLKSKVDKLDIDKLKNVPTNLNNLKSEVYKLVPVPVDLNQLTDVVKNDVVKEGAYNAQIKHIADKISNITNLATIVSVNVRINEVKGEISSITNLDTNASLNAKINEVKNEMPAANPSTAAETKIPNVSNLVNKTDYNTKISEIENKITNDYDHDKYITTQESNKLAYIQTFYNQTKTSKFSKQK